MLIITEIINIFIVLVLGYSLFNIKQRGIKGKFLPTLLISYIVLIIIERINFYLVGNQALAIGLYILETLVLIILLISLIRLNRKK